MLDCEERICEFNQVCTSSSLDAASASHTVVRFQEACRIDSFNGKKSLIRSFPCKLLWTKGTRVCLRASDATPLLCGSESRGMLPLLFLNPLEPEGGEVIHARTNINPCFLHTNKSSVHAAFRKTKLDLCRSGLLRY